MFKNVLIASVFGIVFAASQTSAAPLKSESLNTAKYTVCMDKANGVEENMLECVRDEYTVQSNASLVILRYRLAHLNDAQHDKLFHLYADWITSMQKSCSNYSKDFGPSQAETERVSCMLNEIQKKTIFMLDNLH